jgi:hypothetical protein
MQQIRERSDARNNIRDRAQDLRRNLALLRAARYSAAVPSVIKMIETELAWLEHAGAGLDRLHAMGASDDARVF